MLFLSRKLINFSSALFMPTKRAAPPSDKIQFCKSSPDRSPPALLHYLWLATPGLVTIATTTTTIMINANLFLLALPTDKNARRCYVERQFVEYDGSSDRYETTSGNDSSPNATAHRKRQFVECDSSSNMLETTNENDSLSKMTVRRKDSSYKTTVRRIRRLVKYVSSLNLTDKIFPGIFKT